MLLIQYKTATGDRPDPARCYATGSGLTHLGSADTRSAMHEKIGGDVENLSDSMKMFRLGGEGGKPTAEVPARAVTACAVEG